MYVGGQVPAIFQLYDLGILQHFKQARWDEGLFNIMLNYLDLEPSGPLTPLLKHMVYAIIITTIWAVLESNFFLVDNP